MIRAAAAMGLLLAGATGATAGYDQAFVDAFAGACIPGRLGLDTTIAAATAAGWTATTADSHPELAAVMAVSEATLAEDPELEMRAENAFFARDIEGTPHHLVVSRTSAVIDEDSPPWVLIGCHMYNFAATSPVDPAPVTALVEKPISHSVDVDGALTHVWGPPCPLPRTGDTYLHYVAEGSDWEARLGFSGIALNFSTSEPDPGEEIPDTYC